MRFGFFSKMAQYNFFYVKVYRVVLKGLTRKGMGWGRSSDITYRREKRLAGPGVLSWRSKYKGT